MEQESVSITSMEQESVSICTCGTGVSQYVQVWNRSQSISMYKCGTGDGESVCTRVEQAMESQYVHVSIKRFHLHYSAILQIFNKNTHTTLFILNMNAD